MGKLMLRYGLCAVVGLVSSCSFPVPQQNPSGASTAPPSLRATQPPPAALPSSLTETPSPSPVASTVPLPSLTPTVTPFIYQAGEIIAPENAARLSIVGETAEHPVVDMVFSRDGKDLFINCPPEIYLVDLETLTRGEFLGLETLLGQMVMAVSPDGSRLLVAESEWNPVLSPNWSMVDTASAQKISVDLPYFSAQERAVYQTTMINWSGDGKVLVAGSVSALPSTPRVAGFIDFVDAQTGKRIAKYEIADFEVATDLATSADGKFLAASLSDGKIVLFDVQTGRELKKLSKVSSIYNSVAFSPDSTVLAFGDKFGEITLWDLAANSEIAAVTDASGPVRELSFSPDGRLLYEISGFGWLTAWDTATFQALHQVYLETVAGSFMHSYVLAVSADGKTLATASEDGSLKILGISPAR